MQNIVDSNYGTTPSPSPSPTPTPFTWNPIDMPRATPTGAPMPSPTQVQRIEPYPVNAGTPERTSMYPKLQAKEATIQPQLFDAIMSKIQDDYQRRLALALAFQESSGGVSTTGDNGRSFGPYHIMPGNAPTVPGYGQPTKEQAMDTDWSTQFVNDFMANRTKKGISPEELMLRWNANSGYTNSGPKYDEDIPRFATMAAFIRGKNLTNK
jgi:hypothetical protein